MTAKRLRRRQSWHVLKYYRSVFFENLRKIMKYIRLGKTGVRCVRIKRRRKKKETSSVCDCTVEDVEYICNSNSTLIYICNKLSLRVYCCCCRCILHLQQYSRRLNLFYVFFFLFYFARPVYNQIPIS